MSPARAWFTRVVLAIGAATFLYLLWTFDPRRVWASLAGFGPAFLIVIPFQLADHMINALGWKLAFPAGSSRRARFWDLVRVRVAGDGVNYLTPSGNLAGEFVRPAMMRSDLPHEVKVTSVVIAKAAQAGGQALFILAGLAWVLHGRLFAFQGRQLWVAAAGVLLILGGVCAGVWLLASEPPERLRAAFPPFFERTASFRGLLRGYLRAHPARMAGSTLLFMLGYAWGAAEIWLICLFLGAPVTAATAMAVEFLSNLIDALAFMVPAKVGTQEAGKAAIFAGMGMAAELGFTVGLIRHVRELAWAGLGLALYARHARAAR